MAAISEFWKDLKSGKFSAMIKESSNGRHLNNSVDVYHVMKPMFFDQDDIEQLFCIFLNAENRILAIERMFSGSITSSVIYAREIVKYIIRLKASALILIHNHPSGSIKPSPEDHAITIKVGIALASIDVILHDHIIIGDGYHSMAESGWLKKVSTIFNKHMNGNETAMTAQI